MLSKTLGLSHILSVYYLILMFFNLEKKKRSDIIEELCLSEPIT